MPFDAEPVTSNADSATCRLTSSNLAKVPGLHDRTQDYVHYQMHFTAPIDQAFDVPNSAAQNAIKNVDRHTEEHRKRLEERRARRSERANILQDESKTTAQRIREDKKRRARLQQQREKKRQNSPAWASENDNGSNAKPKAAKRKLGSLPRSAQEKYKNVIASRRLTLPVAKIGVFNCGVTTPKTTTSDRPRKRKSLADIAFNEARFFEDAEYAANAGIGDPAGRPQPTNFTVENRESGSVDARCSSAVQSRYFQGQQIDSTAAKQRPHVQADDEEQDDSDEGHSAYSVQKRRRQNKDAREEHACAPPLFRLSSAVITPQASASSSVDPLALGVKPPSLEMHTVGSQSQLNNKPEIAHKAATQHADAKGPPLKRAHHHQEDQPSLRYHSGYFATGPPYDPTNAWRSEGARASRRKAEMEKPLDIERSAIATKVAQPSATLIKKKRRRMDISRSSPTKRFQLLLDFENLLSEEGGSCVAEFDSPLRKAEEMARQEDLEKELSAVMFESEVEGSAHCRNGAQLSREDSWELTNVWSEQAVRTLDFIESASQDPIDFLGTEHTCAGSETKHAEDGLATEHTHMQIHQLQGDALDHFWLPYRQ